MKNKVIALADNSYTIRRIVELSFSEIENIEVHSFENGAGIKEKLLKLEPDVIIVDIKLPEINGYDICRFINETPVLSHCRVFLMKGSFEAVDNEMIKNLKYEDIVTKPFDSNALVSSVMKILNLNEPKVINDIADGEPSSFPEDVIEIETDSPGIEGISFSDIRSDLETQMPVEKNVPKNQVLERDEILPSEEITQGTQPAKDTLMAPESEETIQNPFDEELVSGSAKLSFDGPDLPTIPKAENEPVINNQSAQGMVGDTSDGFPKSVKGSVNGDTSETLPKSSLEIERTIDDDSIEFPVDKMEETSFKADKGNNVKLTGIDNDVPVQTMLSEKNDIFDFMAPNQNQNSGKAAGLQPEKAFDKELFVQKIRPEVVSPQAELEKLSSISKKEIKVESAAERVLSLQEKTDLSGKLEEKLTLSIKELIWEIVPSLAEKIIKEEIEKIKSEASNTDF